MPKDKVFVVADYLIKKAAEEKKTLSPLKIQKLLYYTQAWNLVFNKKPLFSNEIQAWIHGPAIPEVWQAFRDFNFNSPPNEILETNYDNELSKAERDIIDQVWGVYGKYDGRYLEALTHSELPWQEARNDLEDGVASQNIISLETMQSFYGRKLEEAQRSSQ